MAPLKSSAKILFYWIVLSTVAKIEAQSGDAGSGSYSGSGGSGSGSGDYTEEGHVGVGGIDVGAVCVDDLSRENDEEQDLTSSTAYTALVCSLLCMDNITSNQLYQGIELENTTVGDVWTFKTFPQFSSENEKINCQPYQKFAECVRGCLVRVEPTVATLSDNQCRNECREQCESERNIDDHYFNPYCQIDCNATVCRQGCNNYDRIVRSQSAPGSPVDPVQAPLIVSSTRLADATLSISESAPSTKYQGSPLSSVGTIYRVVDQRTNITRYYQTISPVETLDLEEFACRSVSVSFAVVSKFGVSRESPPLTITVPGGGISRLSAPMDIKVVSVRVDKRPGFFGHAVLDISWNHPQDYMEGLHYYEVRVVRIAHQLSTVTTSPITSRFVTVYDSQPGPDSVFLLEYPQQIQVCTHIWGEDSKECEEIPYFLPSVTNLETTVTITDSVPHWNGSHFNFTIHWTVPEFVAYGDEIFRSFLVVAESKITQRYLYGNEVVNIPNQKEYSYKWLNFYPIEEEYQFTVSIQWQSSRKPSVYDHARCTLSAVPPPASPVLDVTLSDLEFSTGITNEVHQFLVQWSPLTSPIGRVTHYLACLEGARLSDVEDHPHDEFSDDWSNTICQQVDIGSRSYFWKHKIPRSNCIHFKIIYLSY